ncbi:DoxX family protein [Fimbriimonas ginsengisoli]|uniref:DoxX family protein n=1 Tax=Fimbriimonas ginsengisoli Gsoil 348 TaxID=661478 RepID=A0A068NRZ0_FIMGI|nr:DoxX family protein [Fimbriimonas ginsengisoli]AIE86087.1 DoxX family protein [Fimbriimonas ginsengisoli Gsoil 348]
MDKLEVYEHPWAPKLQSVLRIVIALLFLEHGTQKIFNFPPAEKPMPFNLTSEMGIGGAIELVGGILLLLGLFTRPAAFIMAGEMAYAYWKVHAPGSLYPIVNKGELAVAYCFVFLFLAAAGGGPWSLDRLIRRSK